MKKKVKRSLENISKLTAKYQLYQELSKLSPSKREVYLNNRTYCDHKINEASRRTLPVLLRNWKDTPANERNRVLEATKEHEETLEGAIDKIEAAMGV